MRFYKTVIRFLHILLLLIGMLLVLLLGRPGDVNRPAVPASPSDAMQPAQEQPSESDSSETQSAETDALQAAREEAERLAQQARERREREAREQAERLRGLQNEAARLAEAAAAEEEQRPPSILIASDVHYMSGTTHDSGAAFERLLARDDGKVTQYSDILLDALLKEAEEQKPSALLLTGDNTLNGEKENHRVLAQRLRALQAAGVQVLIIPGNHDIQNYNAATYFEDVEARAENLASADEFLEIYHEFGYDQALSSDPASLSYVYALDGTHWLMLLDTAIYEDGMEVEGRVREESFAWMEAWLQQAKEQGAVVIAAGHHNLLSESRLYKTQCTLQNHDEVIALFEKYRVPLYISGHLHAQRIKKHKAEPGVSDGEYGITELVMPPFSIASCQYGSLSWDEKDVMSFETRSVDIPAWLAKLETNARREPDDENASVGNPEQGEADGQEEADSNLDQNAVTEPDTAWAGQPAQALLDSFTEEDRDFLENFPERAVQFTKNIIRNQVDQTIGTRAVPREQIDAMEDLYAELYFDYCNGRGVNPYETEHSPAYRFWERYDEKNAYFGKIKEMVMDLRADTLAWRSVSAEP